MQKTTLLLAVALAFSASSWGQDVKINGTGVSLEANKTPIHTAKNPQAIALLPQDLHLAVPGKFTVAVAALNSESLGLEVNVVPTSWEDWPLGVTSGKYDAAISNITVTKERKEKFDFATYRKDSLGFYVKSTSPLSKIDKAEDIAGLKIIVGSGTNQEAILLAWNAGPADRTSRRLLRPQRDWRVEGGADRQNQTGGQRRWRLAKSGAHRGNAEKRQRAGECRPGGAERGYRQRGLRQSA